MCSIGLTASDDHENTKGTDLFSTDHEAELGRPRARNRMRSPMRCSISSMNASHASASAAAAYSSSSPAPSLPIFRRNSLWTKTTQLVAAALAGRQRQLASLCSPVRRRGQPATAKRHLSHSTPQRTQRTFTRSLATTRPIWRARPISAASLSFSTSIQVRTLPTDRITSTSMTTSPTA